jgi:hypothetical protein
MSAPVLDIVPRRFLRLIQGQELLEAKGRRLYDLRDRLDRLRLNRRIVKLR